MTHSHSYSALRTAVFVALLLLASTARLAADEPIFVFLSHGTWGGNSDWTSLVAGHSTFASELLRALPAGSRLQPLFYRGSNMHQTRLNAAAELAERIDRENTNGFRICLIGHSHGGNVCLRTAGLTSKRIDSVVCLSTPHCYSTHKQHGALGVQRLPVYCSRATLANCQHLISVMPSGDLVTPFYVALEPGLSDNDALFCNEDWQSHFNYPRLRHDGPLADLFHLRNVDITPTLTLPTPHAGTANIMLHTATDDPLGIQPHHQIHSRRTGYVVGMVLRERCSPPALDYLRALIHTSADDDGSPVPTGTHRDWLRANAESLSFSGWVLSSINVELASAARLVADDFDRSLPDPVAVVHESNKLVARSAINIDVSTAKLTVGAFFPIGRRLRLDIRDQDIFTSQSLGAIVIEGGEEVPTHIHPDPEIGRYWAAELQWQWVHY